MNLPPLNIPLQGDFKAGKFAVKGKNEIINLKYIKYLKVDMEEAIVGLQGKHQIKLPPYKGVNLRNYIKNLK